MKGKTGSVLRPLEQRLAGFDHFGHYELFDPGTQSAMDNAGEFTVSGKMVRFFPLFL